MLNNRVCLNVISFFFIFLFFSPSHSLRGIQYRKKLFFRLIFPDLLSYSFARCSQQARYAQLPCWATLNRDALLIPLSRIFLADSNLPRTRMEGSQVAVSSYYVASRSCILCLSCAHIHIYLLSSRITSVSKISR